MKSHILMHITAFIAALLTPFGVWAGIELNAGNWSFAIPLIILICVLNYVYTISWINAQSAQIRLENRIQNIRDTNVTIQRIRDKETSL